MCGICGIVRYDREDPVDRTLLERMTETLAHRGPDGDGYYLNGAVGLGHRRLAVIDLGTGDQPIPNEDESVWIVFNGEIYNFRALRAELEALGHRFRTNTDTECIVHLYEEYGEGCVDRLDGMFAFAIWDENRRLLFAARDRVGKKPFYYTQTPSGFIFGSEIKPILMSPEITPHVDWEAIHHYLTLQYVPHPWSAFTSIRKLPPAHTLVYREGAVNVRRYWDLEYEPKRRPGSTEEIKEELTDSLARSVRGRLISDVPLGAHLSGGIDSSIIVGLMAGMTDQPVKTFSIGFPEEGFSELPYARLVAERFGTDHHEFVMKPEVSDLLFRLARHFDEPFADPAVIPTWHLAEMTRRHVTVALNGDGGDESLAGYQRYYADVIADAYRLVPGPIRRGLIDRALDAIPVNTDRPMERSYLMAIRHLSRAAELGHDASVVRWNAYFTEADKREIYSEDLRRRIRMTESADLLRQSFARARASSRIDRTLYTDVNCYLPGALLPKVDRTTMAHGLEARSPLLDHHFLEFTARLPTRWKVRGRVTKYALRALFTDLVPLEVLDRGKTGFGVPLSAWFKGPLYDFARELLLAPDSRIAYPLRRSAIERIVEENRLGRADNGRRIWALLSLEAWLREFNPSMG